MRLAHDRLNAIVSNAKAYMRENLESTWCNACDDNYIISILCECQLPSRARQLFVMQHVVQAAGHHMTS